MRRKMKHVQDAKGGVPVGSKTIIGAPTPQGPVFESRLEHAQRRSILANTESLLEKPKREFDMPRISHRILLSFLYA